MAAPVSYTEATLSEFMITELGEIAGALGWETQNVAEAVNETLLIYGVDAVGDADDIRKLRAIARWQAWRLAVSSLAARHNFATGDRQTIEEGQMFTAAQANLARAESDARALGADMGTERALQFVSVEYSDDPYTPLKWLRGVL